jgi:diacylglycerol kinase family enzyme
MSYDKSHNAFRVRIGAEEIPGLFALAMNTNPYTYLGNRPLDVAPQASLNTALTVVVFQSLSLPVLSAAALAAFRGTGVSKSRKVVVRDNVTEVEIVADRPFPYQLDGDYLGDTSQVKMVYEPDALGLYFP